MLGREITPHISTIHRILERNSTSLKDIEHRHIRRNEIECLNFLERVEYVNPNNWFDIDGTANEKESFMKRKGRSHVGEKCILPQFHIGKLSKT